MASRPELHEAAADVICILKGITEYQDARVAVIGGLALWKYIPEGRTTQDVDFIVSIDGAPKAVKQKLLSLPESAFIQRAEFFYYKTKNGGLIQIDITPEMQSPYLPDAATKLRDITPGSVPYISPTDLIVFKIYSCGLRAQRSKSNTDAQDAQVLLEKEAMHLPLSLTAAQRGLIAPCIDDVVKFGNKSKDWWKRRLGLPASP